MTKEVDAFEKKPPASATSRSRRTDRSHGSGPNDPSAVLEVGDA